MSLNERLISAGAAACTTDSVDVFGDASGVALYTLDYDASDAGGLYDGTPTNVEFGVGGHINYGAGFNGSSSEIDLPVGLGASGNRARSLWINVSAFPASGGDTIYYIGQQGANDDYEYLNVRSDGTIRYQERHDAGGAGDLLIDSQTTISLNQWYNIVIVFDGLNRLMYINNSTALGNTGTKSIQTVDNSAYAGNLGSFRGLAGTATYDGKIDQVRIFQSALDSTQVTQLYEETACVYTCTTDTVDYPATNLAYYKLDNSAEDETATYDGTATNVNYTFGRFGQAAVFNGSSSKIDTGFNQNVGSNFTWSLWFNSHVIDANYRLLIDKTNSSNPYPGAGIALQGGYVYAMTNGTGSSLTYTGNSYDINEWYHVALTSDGSTVKLYLNSVEVGTGSFTISNTSQNILIGDSVTWTTNYDGLIDQVRIFSSALTSTQVESLYNEKPCEDTSTFKPVLYEGTGATQYISNVGIDLETGGGLIWIKNRDTTVSHAIVDNVRGIAESGTNYIASDTSDAQASSTNMPSSLETNGFFVQGNGGRTNTNNESYVAWVWKAGGLAVSNTNGTITSQVSANQDAGFSIVRFDPNFTASGQSGTVGHGLNQAPEIIITKSLDLALNWWTSIDGITGTQDDYVALNLSTAVDNLGSSFPFGRATNTVFSVSWTFTSTSNDFIAYAFHSVAGVSDFGSYTGNTTSGVTVTTGFEPSWVMIKRTDSANDWVILDNQRDPINPNDKILWADLSNAEANGSPNTEVNFTSTGFSISNTAIGGSINANGGTYIYMAFK